MYSIELSNQFIVDLGEVVSYISHILYNKDAAINLKNSINEAFNELKKNATYYPELKSNRIRQYKYQRYKVGNYYIIYYIDNMVVKVARLIYSGRNFNDIEF